MAPTRQNIEQHITEQLQQHLSPQQVRFVRLLEMNREEAEQEVERELAANPALERVEEPDVLAATEDGSRFDESAEQLQRADYASPDDIPNYRLNLPAAPPPDRYAPVAPDDADDLYTSLLAQLGELDLDADTRAVAEYVVGNLNPNGYLSRTPAAMVSDIAVATGNEVSAECMRRALEAVRSLDPAGVGAESLAQSIELQLLRLPPSRRRDDALRTVREAWDSFLKLHDHRISIRLHISLERARAAMKLISRLNPKPGGSMAGGPGMSAAAVVPDFVVDADHDGHITVTLAGRHPELAVEASFATAMKLMERTADTRAVKGADYISARYNDARDFIALLRQRRDTLLAVITAIVKLQHEYFLTGDESTLRPMTLKDVAALTGRDPSTVSRSTSGKYVQTRAGVLPLRYFFSEGYEGDDGTEISARHVEAALRALVEAENPRRPLSDEALCRALSEKGIAVSRRTVAKYRDRIGIPVARLRRK